MINLENLKIEDRERIRIPEMYNVKQKIPSYKLDNVNKKIKSQLNSKKISLNNIVNPGESIAICVGSRGIDRLNDVVLSVIEEVKKAGGMPFLIPAMGSHGGASSEGQENVLKSYGFSKEQTGIKINSSMETINIGNTEENNIPVYFSKAAYKADHIIVINRVKVHTDYSGDIESGTLKMMAIGLGKHKGASTLHSYGMENFPWVIPEVASYIINNTPITLGIGLLEDGREDLSDIKVWLPDEILEEESKMLKREKELLPGIPFDNIDLLIIDEMGKDISGAGIDPNIIGRLKEVNTDINTIYIRNLTGDSHGNAAGIGMADIISEKLFNKIDFGTTYTNLITSRVISNAKIPLIVENDKQAIMIGIQVSSTPGVEGTIGSKVKIVRIKNTLNLKFLQVSEALKEEVKFNPNLKFLSSNPIEDFIEAGSINSELRDY